MQKEFIIKTRRSVTLNVTGGKIDSFREKEETTGTVRVYENGCIGIAGCLGTPDEQKLTEKAMEALTLGIPYPCKLDGALEQESLHEEEIIHVSDFIPTMQSFLDRLGEVCPKFAFSNKISLNYQKTEYRNSLGRHLTSAERTEAQAICLTLCSVTREIILMLMSCSRGLKKNMMRFIYLPILLPEDILL